MGSVMTWTNRLIGAVALLWLALAGPLTAQDSAFAAIKRVNDRTITQFELNQRVLFMQLLRQPGDLLEQAMNDLTDDRLRLWAAEQLNLTLTPEAVELGMSEFAARANLSTEEFLAAIAQGGVEAQSFRDFVGAGIIWRDVIRTRFAPGVSISNIEIDRAIAAGRTAGGPVKVEVSEILLRTNAGDGVDAMAVARELKATVRTESGFAAAARRLSKAETAQQGGRREYVLLSELPAAAGPQLLAMKVGDITDPIAVPGGVVLYFLRRIGLDAGEGSGTTTLDYAQVLLPEAGAVEEAARLRANVDTCDDLYAEARSLPADRLLRDQTVEGAVPADLRAELARLDPGESSSTLRRGGFRVFVMLCSRTPTTAVAPDREEIRSLLLNARLAALAEQYLAELRAEAIIVNP